jgi:AbrB family looped-hinge helix DNA binding protein
MKATIDAAGRIVVPEPLREATGLKSGQPLEIRARDGRLEILVAAPPMLLRKPGKGLVAVPETELPPLTAEQVRDTLERVRRIEHCALETYSVLTRLTPPHRSPGPMGPRFHSNRLPRPFLRLSASAYRTFVFGLPEQAMAGGDAYDALVAATAAKCRAALVTCDRRAAAVYGNYGVRISFLV